MLGWRREKQEYTYEDNAEFKIRLECEKTKLHSKYIACISIGIVVWLVETGKANTEEFSSWISFASTVASIILSVIAIIMSITGEGKTDAMRNQMEDTAKKLEVAAKAIENANKDNQENIKELKENILLLQEKIELLQGKTDKFFGNYEKDKDPGVYEKTVKIKSDDLVWVKKDDK